VENEPFNKCLVRIIDDHGKWRGCGVVVPSDRADSICVATCAHVVAEAITADRPADKDDVLAATRAPKAPVRILFDTLLSADPVTAFVIGEEDWGDGIKAWCPAKKAGQSGIADIAILRVSVEDVIALMPSAEDSFAFSDGLPELEDFVAPPLFDYDAQKGTANVYGHVSDEAMGDALPDQRADGRWAPCTVGLSNQGFATLTADIAGLNQQDSEIWRIRGGHSGSPVWSPDQTAVVGIIVQSHRKTASLARAIKAQTLARVWRPLQQQMPRETISPINLMNRDEQFEALENALEVVSPIDRSQHRKPIILAVRGPWDSGHVEFRERLSSRFLPERLQLNDKVTCIEVEWPTAPNDWRPKKGWWPFGQGETVCAPQATAAWQAVCDKLDEGCSPDPAHLARQLEIESSNTALIFAITVHHTHFTEVCGDTLIAWLREWEALAVSQRLKTEIYLSIHFDLSNGAHPRFSEFVQGKLDKAFSSNGSNLPNWLIADLNELEPRHINPWLETLEDQNLLPPTLTSSMLRTVLTRVFKGSTVSFDAFKEAVETKLAELGVSFRVKG